MKMKKSLWITFIGTTFFILRILPGENGNDLCIIQSTEDFDSHVGVETRCHEKLFFVASGNAPG